MLTQFKSYLNEAKLPIAIGASFGLVSGAVGAVAALSNANYQVVALEECQDSLKFYVSSEIAGATAGCALGVLFGAIEPGVQMFFSWASNRYQMPYFGFSGLSRRVGLDVNQSDRVRAIVSP